MKTIRTIFSSLMIIAMFIGCEKDDDTVVKEEKETKTNSFIYENTTYDLDSGHIDTWSSEDTDDYAVFSIYLVSSEIQVSDSGQTGTGDAMYFELLSSSLTELTVGKYTFDETMISTPMYCFESSTYTNYNFTDGIGVNLDAVSGELNISKSENIYEIDFNLNLENDKIVTGYYKGELK